MTKQTHKKRKLCFFVNPISGRGKGEKIFNKAQKILQENNIEAVPYISQKKGDIKKSIINMDLMDYDAICVIGGDGSIHEAVNGLISSGKAHYLPLGVISGGFNGGKTKNFIAMAEVIADRVNEDLRNDVIALWHDESQMNRYLIDNPPTLSLNPNYCFAEEFIGSQQYPYKNPTKEQIAP